MTRYYIDQIQWDDLEVALRKLEMEHDAIPMSAEIMSCLGGGDFREGAAMIRYLIEQEKKRISTPRSS
jgi:hypothetical protein